MLYFKKEASRYIRDYLLNIREVIPYLTER